MRHYTLAELAALTDSTLFGDPDKKIAGVDELESASDTEASFLDNPRYVEKMRMSLAGVVFINPSIQKMEGKNYLVHANPTLAFQKAILAFIPPVSSGFSKVHPTAVVHPKAHLEEDVHIGPYAVIDQGARIGKKTSIGAFVFIGAESHVGEECLLHPHVIIREKCSVGNRVIIQPGAVVGSCGFGYFTDAKGKHTLLEQLGKVILEDDVEIGANTTIDRARFKTTRIGQGTKIDNLVQIAHQVDMGKHCLIVSQVGIAGSTKIGNHCVFGGQVGVVGHIAIGSHVFFAARSGVSKSVAVPGVYSGVPAQPIKEHNEQAVLLRQIKTLVKRVKELEKVISSSKEES